MNREEYIVAIVVGLLALVSGGVLLLSMRRPLATPMDISVDMAEAIVEAPSVTPQRAFIALQAFPETVRPMETWEVAYQTNVATGCRVEALDPLERLIDSSSIQITLGKDNLYSKLMWNIGKNVQPGRWTIRLLCGDANNLATANMRVFIE